MGLLGNIANQIKSNVGYQVTQKVTTGISNKLNRQSTPQPALTKCPQCKKPIQPMQAFCPECGKQIALKCPKCQVVAPPGTKFCPNDGSPLK